MPHFHPDPPRIPDSLPSERTVLTALRTLPPEAHVLVRLALLDPSDNHEKELDFVVLHPDLGIVVIETKGKGVQPDGDHWVRRHPDGRVERLKEDPAEQLRAQQWFLLQWLQERVPGTIPQVTRVLALPFCTGKDDGFGPELPACRVLTAEKLKSPYQALRNAVSGGNWEAFSTSRNAALHRLSPERRDALLAVLTPKLLPPPSLAELLVSRRPPRRTGRGNASWTTWRPTSAGGATGSRARRARARAGSAAKPPASGPRRAGASSSLPSTAP